MQRQECELLDAQALPLRNYLMKYVMPSLSEAMAACSTVKPDDPVDFLVRYRLLNEEPLVESERTLTGGCVLVLQAEYLLRKQD